MASAGLVAAFALLILAVQCEGVLEDLSRSSSHHAWKTPPDIAGAAAAAALMLVLPSSLLKERARKAGEVITKAARKARETIISSAPPAGAAVDPAATDVDQSNAGATAAACPPSCFRPNPVCGVDGVTYWCGPADAACAGVDVDYTGFCDIGSKETGSKGVLAVQSLLLVHTLWLMLAAFLVLLGIP